MREIIVSGLREFLGGIQVSVPVSKLAKWKTTLQMIAIATLFAQGMFEHYLALSLDGIDPAAAAQVMEGGAPDTHGLRWKETGMEWAGHLGLTLLWIAAALTLVTGWDYFTKALPHLREDR